MAMVTFELKAGMKLSEEGRREIREAMKHPIVYDEDCPELTDEQLAEFHRVNPAEHKIKFA